MTEKPKAIGKVPESPTRPGKKTQREPFDIADLYSDRDATPDADDDSASRGLDEKLRKAYFWITN